MEVFPNQLVMHWSLTQFTPIVNNLIMAIFVKDTSIEIFNLINANFVENTMADLFSTTFAEMLIVSRKARCQDWPGVEGVRAHTLGSLRKIK